MQLRLAIERRRGRPSCARARDETDIRVRLAERDRATPEALRQHGRVHAEGRAQRVGRGAGRDEGRAERHRARQPASGRSPSTRSCGTGAALGDVAVALQGALAAQPPPPGYSCSYDGQMKTLDEQNEAFALARSALAFVFIYMVLASQFESLQAPLHHHGLAAAGADRRAARPAASTGYTCRWAR